MNNHLVVTISREYGSGGREVGRLLAKKLGATYSDKEAIIAAATELGVDPELFYSADKQARDSFLYSVTMKVYATANRTANSAEFSVNDKLYNIQANIIRAQAEQGDCVIVGGCADFIVRDCPRAFHVFLHAPAQARIQRLVTQYGLETDGMEARLAKADKQRAYFYNYRSGRRFGQSQNYHLTLDSSGMSTQALSDLILEAIRARGLLPQNPHDY